jgi:hypothetical protein
MAAAFALFLRCLPAALAEFAAFAAFDAFLTASMALAFFNALAAAFSSVGVAMRGNSMMTLQIFPVLVVLKELVRI